MESTKSGSRSSNTDESESPESEMKTEQNLVSYLKNILKHRIVPIHFMDLRELVEEASQKLLYSFIEKKYPGIEFLTFLRKYPDIFEINPDNSVQSVEASFCIKDETPESYDEVDNVDMGEYISDQESD